MRLTTISITSLLLVVSVIYGIMSASKKSKQGRLLAWTSFCCSVLMACHLVYVCVDSTSLKEFFYCLEFAAMDWVVFCMFCFVRQSVDKPLLKSETSAIAIAFLFDSSIFCTNTINKFAIEVTPNSKNDYMFLTMEPKLFCIIHYIIIFSVCLFMAYYIARKVFAISRFYRGRYNIAFALFIVNIGASVYYLLDIQNRFDISKFLLSGGVVLLYYSIFSFSPNALLRNLQLYVDDNISDATIIYNYKGDILKINKKANSLMPAQAWSNYESLIEYLSIPESEGSYKKKIGNGTYEVMHKPVKDEKGEIVANTFIFYDVTKMEEQIEREHKIAVTDALTGAYNRTGFFEAANDFLYQNESQAGFALIVSGIIGFKGINALYGNKVGDMVLKFIEKCYHDYNRSYPMIFGRTSEGKYSALVPFDYVDEIAADMTSIDVPIDNEIDLHVDMCHGFVVLDDIAKPLDYYYERALLALDECKNSTTQNILEYSYDMEEQVRRKQLLVAEMHNALREGQFFIELQPQIDLSDRSVAGAEALVRWQHPKLGRIAPGEFVPLFEENGFIINLDVLVWELAAKTARDLSDRGIYTGPVSINVSQVDITGIDVVSTLERIVSEVDIDPSRIHIEITESACAQRRDVLIRTMEQLRQKGFLLEIDDFGSGYSSLNALMKLPFDAIKLDMEFMKESNVEGKNGIILTSIMDMIHAMNSKVIVEGVETETNVENTVRFGGDIAQGYYFSRPLSIEAFEEYVKLHDPKKR